MSKITKRSAVRVADIMKQKKLEQKRILKEKEAAIQAARELEFDKFVRNTAKGILGRPSRCKLQVFDANALSRIPIFSSESSVWAPWSEMFKK